MLRFEWDSAKDSANRLKHGVSFDEAQTVFFDPLAITTPDDAHSTPWEERWHTIGHSTRNRLLVVIHVDIHEGHTRLISARPATRRERRQYEELP